MGNFPENNFAVCVGRSFGSGGLDFAFALSQRLGVPFYDKNILDLAAKNSHIRREIFEQSDERGTFSVPVLYGGAFTIPTALFAHTEGILTNEKLFEYQANTIRELAQERSAVFVGRAADFILKEHPHLLTIFITEVPELCIKNIAERMHLSPDEAAKKIEQVDKKRREYYNFFTSGHWGRADNYHLTIQLSYVGIDYAVQMVVELMKQKGFPINAPHDMR